MATVLIPKTVPELLHQARLQWADRPYLQTRSVESVRVMTFGEVADKAMRMAGGLMHWGVKPTDRVALLSENRPEWVLSYLAVSLTGAAVVPLDSLMAPAELANVVSMARVRVLITTRKFAEALLNSATGGIPGVRIFYMDAEPERDLDPVPEKTGVEFPQVNPGDVASVIFTSGTTGYSKGVVLTHGNICADAQAISDVDVVRSSDNFHLLLPLHHTYSCTVNMIASLALGARATFATSYKSRDIVDDIRVTKITLLVGVPQVFENMMLGIRRSVAEAPLVKRILFAVLYNLSRFAMKGGVRLGGPLFRSLRERAGLNSVGIMISGGAALPAQVNKFFERLGFTLIQGYGLTETSPVLSVNLPGKNRMGTVGTALPGVQLRIARADADGIGEICAKGPMVMQGYFENPGATEMVFENGWFHTGDAGFLDADGYLHITGRIKNVIVTGAGKNIYPEEIEAALNESPYILESLVVGVKRRKGAGEELAAMLMPDMATLEASRKRGHTIDLSAELERAVQAYNHGVPAYRRIRQWKMQPEEFQKTSTRKIKRYLYQDEFQPMQENA